MTLRTSTSPVYILAAVRTPIGKFCGALADLSAVELGAHAIRGALQRAGIKTKDVDEVIMGQVLQAGCGQNPARQAALKAGLPATVNAFTVNKCCGSGLKSVLLAASAIKAGDGDLFVAGGMESMSQAPHLLRNYRREKILDAANLQDAILSDGLLCPICNWHMGNAAEFIAKKYKISRRDQDAFALASHQKAVEAQRRGYFNEELVPVTVAHSGKANEIRADECPRPNTSAEAMAKLPTAFQAKHGTVTAGNAPGLSDGAAAMVLCSEQYLRKRKVKPLAKIVDYLAVGVEPKLLFIAPAIAALRLQSKMKLNSVDWKAFDLVESNEAFAAQALVTQKMADWDPAIVNVRGGAIALGHPLGASGARILVTLIHALRRRQLQRGLATLCMGGGNGLAAAVEAIA